MKEAYFFSLISRCSRSTMEANSIFWEPFTIIAIPLLACCFRCLALLFNLKWCFSTTAIMVFRAFSDTSG